MKLFRILSLLATASLATLLTACGGGTDFEPLAPAKTAGFVQKVDVASAQPVQATTMPAPDCAPEGCNSLRIIDGNAEAYRLDAMRRKALEGNDPEV